MHLEVIVLVFFLSASNGLITYRNYALLHGIPRTNRELQFFNDMEKLYNVTFWKRPGRVKDPVEFTISPLNYAELIMDTLKTKIRFKTIMEDVQIAYDQQIIKRYFKRELASYNWDSYFGLDDIYNWFKDLRSSHPNEVELEVIGKTTENRDIMAVKLKLNKFKFYNARKLVPISASANLIQTLVWEPRLLNAMIILFGFLDWHSFKVIVEGGCHGREWISPAFVTYMIHSLLNANYSNSEQLKLVSTMYDWYFVPIMNPDGYEYSHKHDRLWIKNRREDYGVNLNRNFGILFGKNASTEKRSDEYCGKEPFSEPESAAMASFTRDNSLGLEYYLSVHAYGQYIILPYAFTKSHESNFDSTKKMAESAAKLMFRKYNLQYEIGNNYDTLGYLASGVSADWVKRAINVSYVASFQLPDTGVFGFALPSNKILSTCQATLDGLVAFLDPPNEEMRAQHKVNDMSGIDVNKLNRTADSCRNFWWIVLVITYCLFLP